jgi:hypothetical protein
MSGIEFAKHFHQTCSGVITVFFKPVVVAACRVVDTDKVFFGPIYFACDFEGAACKKMEGLQLCKSGGQFFRRHSGREEAVLPLITHENIHAAPRGIRSDFCDKKVVLIVFQPDAFVDSSCRKKGVLQFRFVNDDASEQFGDFFCLFAKF